MDKAKSNSCSGNTNTEHQRKKMGWILTHWNEESIIKLEKNVIYSVAGKEICPETGKEHWHQFIYFKNARTFGGIKKLTSEESHIEMVQGTISQAVDYCKKDGNITYEFGKQPNDNGHHNIAELVENYNTITEIMEQHPETYCRNRNGLKDLYELKNRKNRLYKPPEVYWIYGRTGTGKTKMAFENNATNVEYNNGFLSDWGDAKIISIEEMRGEIPYKTLLKLTDAYQNYYHVNIKGGQKLVCLDIIYITSPDLPENIYRNQVNHIDSIDQLKRRITKVIHMIPDPSSRGGEEEVTEI